MPLYQNTDTKPAQYHPGGSDCGPAILAGFTGVKAASEANRCKEAADEHRLKADDLVQQTRAADAAQAAAMLGYDATRIALAGLIGGLLTLIAAGFAAYYARKAYTVSQHSLEIETRPFLFVERIEPKQFDLAEGGFGIRFTFFISNIGQLPATDLRIWTSAQGSSHFKRVKPEYGGLTKVAVSLPKAPPRRIFETIFFDEEEGRAFRENRVTISLSLKAVFNTRFKQDKLIEEHRWVDQEAIDEGVFYLQPLFEPDSPTLMDQMTRDLANIWSEEADSSEDGTANDDKHPDEDD